MRILHELNQLEKGGAERVVAGIIRHDKENQHTVYSYKDGPMRPVFEALGARVIVESPEETINMDADIIHIHTGGDASQMASQVKNQIATVETVHSPVTSAVRDAFVQVRVGVSNVVTRKNRKCMTIYNGVDIDRLEKKPQGEIIETGVDPEGNKIPGSEVYRTIREKLGIPHDAFVVGRLGRLAPEKLVEDFFLTCWYAEQSGLIPNLHVLVVGDEAMGARNYLGRLKVMAASLPLKNVHFHPAVEEVGWAYAGMDIFLYPSPEEGFGLVFLEAMACRVPVLTLENELTREILLGGAMLTKQEGIKGLKDCLIYLYLQRGIRHTFATQGVRHALNRFTEDRMSAEYQKLYQKVFADFYGKEPGSIAEERALSGATA